MSNGLPMEGRVEPAPPIAARLAVAVMLALALMGGRPTSAMAAPSPEQAAMDALELARHHYARKEYKEAAKLFHRAYDIHPLPEFLFNAGRAEQRAFQLDAAERDLRALLALPDLDPAVRKRASVHLTEVMETKTQFAAVRKPTSGGDAVVAAPGAATPTAAPSGWQRTSGWAALGLGGAAFTVGSALFIVAALDQSRLDEDLDKLDANELHSLDYDAYKQRQGDVDRRNTIGWSTFGPGVALLAAGVWLVMDSPADKTAALRGKAGGFEMAWRF